MIKLILFFHLKSLLSTAGGGYSELVSLLRGELPCSKFLFPGSLAEAGRSKFGGCLSCEVCGLWSQAGWAEKPDLVRACCVTLRKLCLASPLFSSSVKWKQE